MLSFAKGHGTRNDFVLVTDADDARPLTDDDVRFLADRRSGIGGDGVLRAVRARHVPGWDGDPDLWFMDYRNADGSIAEMCGNGVRVFARYLVEEGLVPEGTTSIDLGTRAGLRTAELLPDGRVRVWMGRPETNDAGTVVRVDGQEWGATSVDVGNPHAVVLLGEGDALAALDLGDAPEWTPRANFPHGVNVEFVDELAEDRVRMRVFERGVGETESCGTGTVAVASAVARAHGKTEGRWTVEVPGGEVVVDLAGGEAWLTGPAVIVARGHVDLPREEKND
ncbi:diaminopimelate epimerase [Propioniciclava sp. MC1595]|uniref:diaminopimelate epimerase n=1 Tax=unclassified Propioniciclava TaxID=2642922 RepID=UPI001602EDBE|nr:MULTISPECIES: diaminopimelate epimerase [unclassified Propioniciclava]MBB1494581.1 diaminopimelate epimerase [Propioniciclava sp. MC1595]MBB1501244.1 diaminopimelate epimerase [Propioniciclava sp. MC1683]NLE17875.1 diaminopimelate epimerase [Propioniciclava sp.]QTE27425.1 diaminopimelate epimerase [Propioniciclava sp. MC1595]